MKDLVGRVEDSILSRAGDSAKVAVNQKKLCLTHNRFDLAFKMYLMALAVLYQEFPENKTSEA